MGETILVERDGPIATVVQGGCSCVPGKAEAAVQRGVTGNPQRGIARLPRLQAYHALK